MFWFFIDVNPNRPDTPEEDNKADAWEQALLDNCRESEEFSPNLNIYRKIDSSVETEIGRAIESDMYVVYICVALWMLALLIGLVDGGKLGEVVEQIVLDGRQLRLQA